MESFNKIKDVLNEITGDRNFALTVPEEMSHGDFATNIAFILSKQQKISPKDIAEKIIPKLKEKLADTVSKIDLAGAGFINFYLKDEVVRNENSKDLSAQAGIKSIETKYTGKNILVEHSSPNLFKPFHIGHLMNNIIGEFVTRATKIGGGNTKTISFPSDISLGIAKAIFIIKEDKEKGVDILGATNEESKVIPYLGECYIRGVKLAEENPELEKKIKDLSKELFNQIDGGNLKQSDAYNTYKIAHAINIVYFKNIVEDLGSHIDYYIFESEAGKEGKKITVANKKVFTEGERGAIIYTPDEDRKDINTAVFINSEGHPTYEAKDLGLLKKKFSEYGSIDYSLFVTDTEQIQHFKVVFDACEKLGDRLFGDKWKTWASKSKHIPHGRMTFKGQKMSSRLGGVPLALETIETVKEEVRERAGEKIAHLSSDEKNKLEKDIALSALRIAVLRSKPGLNINFDGEASLSFEGDSGPYLMYTHARCSSLLEKGKEKKIEPKFGNYEKSELEWKLHSFELVLKDSIEELAPQKLVTYLFGVAQEFNSFYGNTQIITDDKEKTAHNLMIVSCVRNVLKTGLYVLGIEAPTKM